MPLAHQVQWLARERFKSLETAARSGEIVGQEDVYWQETYDILMARYSDSITVPGP